MVLDVSSAADLYGPGRSYSKFAGRACTRGVALPSLEDLDISDDISDFSPEQHASVEHWREFFRTKYTQVGVLLPDPSSTERVTRRAAEARRAEELASQAQAAAADKVREAQGAVLSAEELARHDGSDERLPVYIGLAGHVLDVSRSRNLFGSGKPRGCWSGRDATMAILHKTCEQSQLDRTLEDASEAEVVQLERSLRYFLTKYTKVGTLVSALPVKGSGANDVPPQVQGVAASLDLNPSALANDPNANPNDVEARICEAVVKVTWRPLTAGQADSYLILGQPTQGEAQPHALTELLDAGRFRSQRAEYSISCNSFPRGHSGWRLFVVASRDQQRGALSTATPSSEIHLT
eukprot:TRINITY_DN7963_c0_g2_i1.p1 TRINITY_DN7963_c0_g2~~TRINITY_DN7963_c0_g2_i1.p1  ORF type:complete len:351 (+),score=55.03 TRINITY_DN7963_c0_g2_i1:401-1453(+)